MSKIEKTINLRDKLAMVVGKNSGKNLVDAAISQIKEERAGRVIAFITSTIKQIQNLESEIEQRKNWLKFQNDRLAAINAGKFSIVAGNVIFENGELNSGTM